jgi:hypothetical protein
METCNLSKLNKKIHGTGAANFLIILGIVLFFPISINAKVKLPAEIVLELIKPVKLNQALTLIITAESRIPFNTGNIYLIVPPIGSEQSKEVLIWTDSSDTPTIKKIEYNIQNLPIGKYQFRATFDFYPKDGASQIMRVGSKLFIDVRSDAILSSNISFNNIKRLELKRELENLGISKMSKTQQRSIAPDLIKQIEELNRLETVPQSREDEDFMKMKQPPFITAPSRGIKDEVPSTVEIDSQEKVFSSSSPEKDYSKGLQAEEKRRTR